ncbi:MAG: DJ-1/PfpI family protein [bacterium]|nr:DJ-1/PfpI family protein [Candidatus Margulisiibacteriota bacterium]
MATDKRIKKAVMIIAFEKFRDEEYLKPKQILEQAGIEITTASTQKGIARGKLGAQVIVDILLKQIKVTDYDAIIFIGGPGSYAFFDDPTAHNLAREAIKEQKILGGICAAAAILAKAGALAGKKAACFVGVADILKEKGALYSPAGLEVDGKTVTADGPEQAKGFGEELVKLING